MALGDPPLQGTSLVGRLFAPLILPLLTILISAPYFYASQLRRTPVTNDEDVTRPLISGVGGSTDAEDDGYPGFGSSCGADTPVTPYGAI